MGTFAGHAIPGTFFIIFSLWHTLQISIRYFQSCQRNAIRKYKSRAYFLSPCCPSFPVESFLKSFSCCIGFIGETVTAIRFERGRYRLVNWGNTQHMTMFFFFGLSGVIEMMHFYRLMLPPNSVYVSNMIAFIIESVLFYWHLQHDGRTHMDVQLHYLLLYVVIATIVVCFIEMIRRTLVLPALSRAYFVMLQGLWFWQVGFILYPWEGMSKWDEDSHVQMTQVTVVFCMHAAAALIILLCVWFGVACRYNSCRKEGITPDQYSSLAMKVLHERPQDSMRLLEDGGGSDEEDEIFSKS